MNAHPFSLRQLQYAVAVAESGGFRRAAERCHVSQPSLSAQLAQLESALGVRLFERDRRRILLTQAGAALLERAKQVLRGAEDLAEAARHARDPFAGTLRLGVIPTLSPYLLPRLTPALSAAYPRLSIVWVEDKTSVLMRDLQAGELDAALVALEADLGDVERAIIARDPFVLAAAAGSPLGRQTGPARPSDLASVDVLLLDEGHCFREQALELCTRARARELDFRATSLSTLAQMVAAGAGVTLLPTLAVATEAARAALSIRPFATPVPHRTVALVWRKRSPLGEAMRKVSETIRAAYPASGTRRVVPSRAARS